MKYNRELQVIDTQEKAYLLGLFYADGNIHSTYCMSRLELSINDGELLFHLLKLFPFFEMRKDRETRLEIHNYQKSLKEDLINNGCLPRKSFDNRENMHIPSVSDTLLRHFIRGYFDGDGGCTLSKSRNKTQKRVYIYSASLNFLHEIADLLDTYNIKTSFTSHTTYNIEVGKLQISTKNYNEFYDFLYKEATIYLNRKKVVFEQILKTNFFVQQPAPICKFCNSLNTVNDGYTYYKGIRRWKNYLCKDCKRHFTALLSSNIQNAEDELLEA